MLCMNCQYGVGSSIGDDHGYDAGAGAYGLYLNGCGAGTNQRCAHILAGTKLLTFHITASLPNDVQAAVCNQNIRIPSYVYRSFWSTGDWFYEYTKGSAQLSIQSGKNDSGLCNTTSTSTTSATASSTSIFSPTGTPNSGSTTNIGAIVGGALGGVALLVLALLAGFLFNRKKNQGTIDLTEENDPPSQAVTFEPYQIPLAATGQQAKLETGTAPNSSGHIHVEAASALPSPSPRRTKPGLFMSSPLTRAEIQQSQPLLGLGTSGTSMGSSERHEDSEELTSAFALGRSPSGRLPPSYQDRE
ncbi:hypothetical protein CTheo_4813 [Ceratobasidium theobromae]|uniref:Transmembrane protein n=1 Tax=Ceratobasidium theobromae TaxID=1582974 RepID=A0A5N5QJD2_9AGAM|nr:hypothetical protein CTheo_4813 [Ceratobasidium theobromae]